MQTLTSNYTVIKRMVQHKNPELIKNKRVKRIFISGFLQRLIRQFIWLNILGIAVQKFKNPVTAFKKVKALKRLRNQTRNNKVLPKYEKPAIVFLSTSIHPAGLPKLLTGI